MLTVCRFCLGHASLCQLLLRQGAHCDEEDGVEDGVKDDVEDDVADNVEDNVEDDNEYENEDCTTCEDDVVASNDEDDNQQFTCPGDGLFANPNDCYKYYQCYNGKQWKKDCHPDLYWNQDIQPCDRPKTSSCPK